jgi:hypothetical protein
MRKLLSEFKKVAAFDYSVIEVLLFGYASYESTYLEALKLIAKNKLYKSFKDCCQSKFCGCTDTGWGVREVLLDACEAYFRKE